MVRAAVILLFLGVGVLTAQEYTIAPARLEHWAWQRPTRGVVPITRNLDWPSNPMDRFVLARLEAAELEPAGPAAREQLLRRVTFDLLGLPPTPEEVDSFVQDESPDAWVRVVDRLLASPHHGERWGRHWLDLARYADSNGYEFDEPRPDAWRYRDYVIASFNADKPFDRFVQEQLAGDELWPDDPAALIATGFNLLGPDMTDASEQAQRRLNTLNDMTDTAGLAFLGLTVACARCHNHKFEPIPQTDYYRLQAFFAPASFRRDLVIAGPEEQAEHARRMAEYRRLVGPAEQELANLETPYRQRLREAKFVKISDEAQEAHRTPPEKRTPRQNDLVAETGRLIGVSNDEVLAALSKEDRQEHARLTKAIKELEGHRPRPLAAAMGLRDDVKTPARTFFLERGERTSPGAEVQPGFPLILSPQQREAPAVIEAPSAATTGRRTALARWLTSGEHPLTGRVFVNRLWQHHFGRGIVATPSDFGLRGERPTHPELLDWLACEFVEGGWQVKRMHRLMLLSSTYQQSTRGSPAAEQRDPQNLLLGRMRRQRLEGEAIRDGLLAISGRLNRQMGGVGVFPPLPAELTPSKAWPVSRDRRDHGRRSVYVFVRRNQPYPFLQTFDLPETSLSCPRREQSVTAPQALTLLNAEEVLLASRALAERIAAATPDRDEQARQAYRVCLGRTPTPGEAELVRAFLAESPLSELCRALVNANEFVFVD
jgi:hypothetical protein